MQHLNPTPAWGLWWSSCILFVLLKVMLSCSSSAAISSQGNETDRMALLDIKLHMSDPSGVLSAWNDSQHHCQWPGVICNMRHRRVAYLVLQGKSLSGTISPYLGNLSFIKGIYLGGNSLHGGVPPQIGKLSRLGVFNLSNNLLSGEISFNLTTCLKLRYLNLERNYLIGEIPVELGSLTNLEFFAIDVNNLTGKIPASLGNLSSLVHISFGRNNLEGYIPTELGSLSTLLRLGLGPNKLRGEIPSSVFNISTLEIFSVTQTTTKLPTNLGLKLPSLQFFLIGENYFSGEIPISFTNCTYLERIDLGDNKFEGKFPPIGQLLNLQEFNLELNSLHGDVEDILEPLTNCTNLLRISLYQNNFTGELPNTIGNLSSHLARLNLAFNKISGTIPMEVGNLVGLEMFSLEGNSLTGVIPANLGKIQNLKLLFISMNMLSGQISPILCSNLTNLYLLGLYENNLEGVLSHSLAKCRSLQELYISDNKFSGSISSQIFGSYISPTQLDLSSNSLSGPLPLEIGKLANLQELNVSKNKLSGHIPSTIGDCSIIATLDMRNNNFSGSLPLSLASLKGMDYLDLSDNTLTGPIPDGMSQLLYLKFLNLSYNNLEGKVPTDGVFSNASQIMLQGNTKLCGGIVELGLPACSVHKKTKLGKKHLIIILTPLLFGIVISITLFIYVFLRKKSGRFRAGMPSIPTEEKMLRVSYHELYRATREFSPANLIGSGNFGFVYKCSLVLEHEEIKVVAVKVLDLKKSGASKGFKAECKALSNLRHRNLVPLLTYCSSIDHKGDEFKALVYKFMEKGNLDTWLHPDMSLEPKRCLSLGQRINVASDVASALDHLHNHSHVAVAHCDIKPSNILLDDELTAYVGDFGLARILPQLRQGASSSTIAIKGTIGYTAPDLRTSGSLSSPQRGCVSKKSVPEEKLAAARFLSSFPHFVKIMKKFNVSGSFTLNIPYKFAMDHLPGCKTEIVLRNLKGKSWTVNSIPTEKVRTIHTFCGGWMSFVRENDIQIGDICIFELIGKNEMRVHISQSGLDFQHGRPS